MSKPAHAQILPISDISLSREANTKLRLTGLVTAIQPPFLVLTDLHPSKSTSPASLLVDINLCVGEGVKWDPPELKSKLMVIGHLIQRSTPANLDWMESKGVKGIKDLSEPQVGNAVKTAGKGEGWVPNKWFVLEALLLKPLDPAYDLALWNYTARLRSKHEWEHHGSSKVKGKRKAED